MVERTSAEETMAPIEKEYHTIDGKRYIMGAFDKAHDENGYIPCAILEDTPGYRMLSGNGPHAQPWYWGETREQCQEVCDHHNRTALGYTDDEIIEIRQSSLKALHQATMTSNQRGRHAVVEKYLECPTNDNWVALRDFVMWEQGFTVVVHVEGGNVQSVDADVPGVRVIVNDQDNIKAGDEPPDIPESVIFVVY